MTVLRLIYLSNALDEGTRSERRITSDSPAATQKVLQIALALRKSGVSTIVLSLGRGRQKGTGKWFAAKVVRSGGVTIVYAPFFDFPIFTHLVSLLGLLPLVWRLRWTGRVTSILAYNRLPHYLVCMELARLIGWRRFLDLEDGDVRNEGAIVRQWIARILTAKFDTLCNAGGVLAARSLASQYAGSRTVCCYGVATSIFNDRDWLTKPLVVLLGGTLQRTTGAQLFIDAIRYLRNSGRQGLDGIEFVVTGKGDMAESLQELSTQEGLPSVRFLGSVSRDDYVRVVRRAHIGLALKLPSSDLADTTFPSKVIELASAGLMVLSTRISDVPNLFKEDGAIYLLNEDPQAFANQLLGLVENRDMVARTATRGQLYIEQACAPQRVGQSLKAFFSDSGL